MLFLGSSLSGKISFDIPLLHFFEDNKLLGESSFSNENIFLGTFISEFQDYATFYFLDTDEGLYELIFTETPSSLAPGNFLEVSGVLEGEVIFVSSYSVISAARVDIPPNPTIGEQRVALVLIKFLDNLNEPISLDDADSLGDEVDQFYQRASYGKTSMNIDVFGYYTINGLSANCNYRNWRLNIVYGYGISPLPSQDIPDWTKYDRLVIAFPLNEDCSFSGVARTAPESFLVPHGSSPITHYMTVSWLNGASPRGLDVGTFSHELGHNQGLLHASDLECGQETVGEGCYSVEYGDFYDVMGRPSSGYLVDAPDFNVIHKEKLGWLDQSDILEITSDSNGFYDLGAIEVTDPLYPEGIKFLAPTRGNDYYIEYRLPIGADANADPRFFDGVILRLDYNDGDSDTHLLDTSPHSNEIIDQVADSDFSLLRLEEDYIDSDEEFSVQLISLDPMHARIRVWDPVLCGNNIVDAGEGCDDGNTLIGDGCSSFCDREPIIFKEDDKKNKDRNGN